MLDALSEFASGTTESFFAEVGRHCYDREGQGIWLPRGGGIHVGDHHRVARHVPSASSEEMADNSVEEHDESKLPLST